VPDRIKGKDNHYEKLYALMKVLREECPWDKEQTLLSLRRYTLEEVHEVLEAIDIADSDDNWEPLKSELGDLLIQVLFYSRIAEENGKFNLADVIDALIDKMIYRHPHIFDNANPKDLTEQWNKLKDAEHTDRKSLMDEIPPLPALKYAQKQQQRAARVGFDWTRASDVIVKMREELDELEHEVTNNGNMKRIEDEFGDVLFTLTNLARKLSLDAELCLMSTNRKFANRFRMMERLADDKGISLDDLDLDQQEELYKEAKGITN